MKSWCNRPREIRNLFNPAFCGVLLMRAIGGYKNVSDQAMPYSLTLVVPALCLHQQTRKVLVAGNRSYFTKIVEGNPKILVGLAERVRGLFPSTMEAFEFLANQGAINVSSDGGIEAVEGAIRKVITGSEETKECQRIAVTLGKKFAQTGDRVTVFTTLGIRP